MMLVATIRYPVGEYDRVRETLKRQVPGVQFRRSNEFTATVRIPDHAAHCWELALGRIPSTWRASWNTPVGGIGDVPDLMDLGQRILRRLDGDAHLQPGVAAKFADHQVEALAIAAYRRSHLLELPCGAGKTWCALAWIGLLPGNALYVTRVSLAIKVAREVRKLTSVEPHIWLPPSRRRKKYETTAAYLARMTATGQRALVILGHENLTDALADLTGGTWASLVVDEIHRLASWRRWEPQMGDSGARDDVSFKLKDNQSAAAFQISRLVKRRLGLTATFMPDRVRNMWSPLDIILPGEFGAFYDFAHRFCAAHPGSFGGIDTTGTSNAPELRDRLAWVLFQIPLKVVQRGLPPLREDVVWLSASDLQAPLGGWKRELGAARKLGGEHYLEAQMAQSASMKRRWVVGQVEAATRTGEKVLIFTGRRADVEFIHEALRDVLPDTVSLGWTHGGCSPESMQASVDEYMQAEGAAVLVATYDSIGEGQDLQDTDLELVLQLPWSPVTITQIRGRVNRPGQKRPVLVRYVLAEGTIDERVLAILTPKLLDTEAILGDTAAGATGRLLQGDADAETLLADLAAWACGQGANVDWAADVDDEDAA